MITQIGQPIYSQMPGYNPVVYYFESNKSQMPGFRYIAQVKDEFGNLMFEKSILPDFDDGKCVLQINQELSDYLSYDLHLDKVNSNPYHASKSYKKYKIEVGEEYYYQYKFQGFQEFHRFPDPSWTLFFFSIVGVDYPEFTVGDQVNVYFDSNTPDAPGLIGQHTVKFIVADATTAYVALDYPYNGPPSSNSGYIDPAPNDKIRRLNQYSTQVKSVFNGVFDSKGFLSYFKNRYFMNATGYPNPLFLSQASPQIKARRGNSIFLNYMKDNALSSNTIAGIRFVSDVGVITQVPAAINDLHWIMQVNVGPSRTHWGTVLNLTGPIVTPTTKWYTFQGVNAAGIGVSETYKVILDDSCPVGTPFEILYLDKLGSFLPYNFTLKNVESQSIQRDEFTKHRGYYNYIAETYTYDLTDAGSNIYNTNYSREWILRTKFLNDEESIFFQNVLHSPITVMKIDGSFQRVSITTNNIEIKQGKWSGLKRYELNVKLANQDKINI